jgi:tetratricopeptide (TPR) repeat protein
VAGADFAVVGQFMYDDESFNLDLRVFSAEESEQIASFQKPVPASGIFDALAEAALFVVTAIGLEPGDEVNTALHRNPTTSLQAYRLYLRSQSEREPEKHMELLRQALELDPDYLDAAIDLGLGYYRMGKGEDALPYMQRAAALGFDMPEVHNNLAVLYADMGMKEEALKEFGEALDLKPDYPEARLNYGRLLEESGRLDQAEGIYNSLLESDPDNIKARSSLALLYERTGRTELAVQEFRVLSRRNPELAENYFIERGQSARKAKEYGNAEKFFLRAVDINPQLSQGYAELGTNSYLAGEYDRSLEYFRKALALEPQRAEYHHYLGLALEKSGNQDEAKTSFQRSAELGGPLETRLSLARVYLAAGEVTRAIDELNLVLDEDPSAEEAKELLARTMRRAETDQQRAEQRAEFATHRLGRLESIIDDLTRTNRDLESRVLALQMDRRNMDLELAQLREYRATREKEFGRRMEEATRSIEQYEKLQEEYALQLRRLEEQLAKARRASEETGELQSRLVAVELESYQRIEEARGQAAAEVSAKEKDLESSRDRERQALLEKERLEHSVAEIEGRLAAGEERARQALRAEQQVREALERTLLDLAQQSLELGRMHMRNRSWNKARAAFEKVLDINPRNGEAYYSLGEIFSQLGEFDRSKEMYERAKDIF